jgi:hypothetical protein
MPLPFSIWERIMETREIPYKGNMILVRVMSDTKEKIVLDQEHNFYYFDVTRNVWRKVRGGIYALYRALSYILLRYTYFEVPELKKILAEGQDVHLEFMTLDRDNVDSDHGDHVRTLLGKMSLPLDRVVDQDKLEGREQIGWCIARDLRDSQGRLNVGMLMCRTSTASRRLNTRLRKIARIQPRILFLHERVQHMIHTLEGQNDDARRGLRQAFLYTRNPIRVENGDVVKELLNRARDAIQKTNVRPYERSRLRLLKEMDQALSLHAEGKVIELHTLILRMGSALRLKAVRGKLELAVIDLTLAIRQPSLFAPDVQHRMTRMVSSLAHSELPAICEAHFRRPVAKMVRIHLLVALKRLNRPNPLDTKMIKEIKTLIMRSARMI